MTTVFGFFKLVDKLFEFIELGWADVLKRDPECVPSNPLHAPFFNRNWFLRARNDQPHADHFAGVDFEVAIEPGASDREVQGNRFGLMGVSQQESLQLYRHSPVLSSLHVTHKISVASTIQKRYGGASFRISQGPHPGPENSITEA